MITIFRDELGRRILQDIQLVRDGETDQVIGEWLGIKWVLDETMGPDEVRLVKR